MKHLILLVFLLWGPGALATEFPALGSVVGVATNDSLNIRAQPSARSEIRGAYSWNRRDIEIVAVSQNGRWGQVNHEEGTGWVSLRYVSLTQDASSLPSALFCFGTEPFWNAKIEPNKLTFSSIETPKTSETMSDWLPSANLTGKMAMLGTAGHPAASGVVVTRQMCSDGMSDRAYGYSIDLMKRTSEQQFLVSGCCSLSQ